MSKANRNEPFYRYVKDSSGNVLTLKIVHGEKNGSHGIIKYMYTFCSPEDKFNPDYYQIMTMLDYLRNAVQLRTNVYGNFKSVSKARINKFVRQCEKYLQLDDLIDAGIFNDTSKHIAKLIIEDRLVERDYYQMEVRTNDEGKLDEPISKKIMKDMYMIQKVSVPKDWNEMHLFVGE